MPPDDDSPDTPRDEDHRPLFPVESARRLSQSLLWTLQRRYFDSAGIEAWRNATVPHYVTNNPALAHAYAEVLLGFLRDCQAGLDPTEPVTIVELGAGSGRFAYLVLRALMDRLKRSPLSEIRVRYVMTDFTEKNLAFWREHAALRPFVERGVLDFAVFDAEEDREIRLVRAGVTLSPGSLKNPLAIVANYVFDGLSQDAFWFDRGELSECLVSLASARVTEDLEDPSLIGRLLLEYTRRPALLDYYEEPELDAILRFYARTVEGKTVLFPSAAIRSIGRLAEIARGRVLLLSGDRGDIDPGAVAEAGDPRLVVHGSFSLSVNYHAIAEYVARRSGRVLKTGHGHSHLHVSAFLLGDHPKGYPETSLAYHDAIEVGPDDFFSLRRGIQDSYGSLDLEAILSLVRLSRWDPRILRDCLPVLWARLDGAGELARQRVLRMITTVWENYYAIGESQDLAFELALLAGGYGGHREALELFRESKRLYGEDPKVSWNMGLCHYALGEVDAALAFFGEAARIDPAFSPVGAVQVKA